MQKASGSVYVTEAVEFDDFVYLAIDTVFFRQRYLRDRSGLFPVALSETNEAGGPP